MTPTQLAHEFFLGIRTAMTCPDVNVTEYAGVMAHKIEAAVSESREQGRREMREEAAKIATRRGDHVTAELIRALK